MDHVHLAEHGDQAGEDSWGRGWVAASSRQKDGTWIFPRVTARVTSAAQAGSIAARLAPGPAGWPERGRMSRARRGWLGRGRGRWQACRRVPLKL